METFIFWTSVIVLAAIFIIAIVGIITAIPKRKKRKPIDGVVIGDEVYRYKFQSGSSCKDCDLYRRCDLRCEKNNEFIFKRVGTELVDFMIPCFIRVASEDLCNRLMDLGYKLHPNMDSISTDDCSTVVYKNYYWTTGEITHPNLYGTDCGVNISLFLSLAALRELSDYLQWFTNGKTWRICTKKDWIGSKEYHKANIEELNEHFTTLLSEDIRNR